jgi:hypothetical protein
VIAAVTLPLDEPTRSKMSRRPLSGTRQLDVIRWRAGALPALAGTHLCFPELVLKSGQAVRTARSGLNNPPLPTTLLL